MSKIIIEEEKLEALRLKQADKIFRQTGSTIAVNKGVKDKNVEFNALNLKQQKDGKRIVDTIDNETGVQYIERILTKSNVLNSKNSNKHFIKLYSITGSDICHATLNDPDNNVVVDSLSAFRTKNEEGDIVYKGKGFNNSDLILKEKDSIKITLQDFKSIYVKNIQSVCLNEHYQKNRILENKMININPLEMLQKTKDSTIVVSTLNIKNNICKNYVQNEKLKMENELIPKNSSLSKELEIKENKVKEVKSQHNPNYKLK